MFNIKKIKIKEILKKITIFLVITAWLFSGWPPISLNPRFPEEIRPAKAVVPAGVIVAWPGAAGSIPSGWSRVDTLDSYFLEGTTSTPSSSEQGTSTHSHLSPTHTHIISHTHNFNAIPGSNLSTRNTGNANSYAAIQTHSHPAGVTDSNSGSNNPTAANLSATSNDPPYVEVIWIQSNGTADIPDGAWVYYDTDSLPAGWVRTGLNSFLKGASAGGSGGATGGSSDSHTHNDLGHTHTQNSHTHTGTVPASTGAVAGTVGTGNAARNGHTHQLSGGSVTATENSGNGILANADGQPPFTKMNIIENNTGSNSLPGDIIAMWSGSISAIPDGWVVCNGSNGTINLNDRFIKGSGGDGEVGVTGGSLVHSHSAASAHNHVINDHSHTFSASASSDTTGRSGNGSSSARDTHTHAGILTNSLNNNITGDAIIAADANTDNRPPFKEVVYIKYKKIKLDQIHYRWRNDDGGEGWYDSDWNYRKRLTINNNEVSGSSDLSNFPVLVSLTDENLKATSSLGHVEQLNGEDILFTDVNGNKLDHEIEKYVSSSGELVAWVRIPSLSTSVDTNIYLYYGNATCSNQQNVTGVWDSNYRMVMHLDETTQTSGSYNDHQDSTSNNNHGEAMNSPDLDGAGKIDGADSFSLYTNGADYISCNTNNLPLIGSAVALSVWANFPIATTTTRNLILVDNNTNAAYQVGFRSGLPASWGFGGVVYVSSAAPSANTWHYYTYTYDGTNHRLYVDGVETDSSTDAAQSGTPTLSSVNTNRWTEHFGGLIDEARISNIARSADWIATEYNNQSSPSTFFYSITDEQETSDSATWAANEDTPLPSIAKGEVKRLRFEISNEGQRATSTSFQLEVSEANPPSGDCSLGTYTRVDSSADWDMATSTYIFDGEPTVNISSGLTDENSNFVSGQLKENDDTTGSISLNTTQFTELEFSLKPTDLSMDGAHYCFRLTAADSANDFIYSKYGEVSVNAGVNLRQSGYRFFANQDSTGVDSPLAEQNMAAQLTQIDEPFRLRLLLHVSTGSLPPNLRSFKLQYAIKGGDCGSGETYYDVATNTPIAFYDNDTPTDGLDLIQNISIDPAHGSDEVVPQTYEEANNFSNPYLVSPSKDGMWDFSLQTKDVPSNTSYCLRAVHSSGTVLNYYDHYPVITSPYLYEPTGYYISHSYDAGAPTVFNTIEWTATSSSPDCVACQIKMQIQTAPDSGGVPGVWSNWCGPEGKDGDETDYFTIGSGQMIHTDHNGDQWIRYKASFEGDQLNTPILEEVIINYQ